MSKSKKVSARDFLGQMVSVKMDRPLGVKHPKFGFTYPVNYGFIPNTISGDGEELDAYVLGVDVPMDTFNGRCIAIIHRTDDDDDKLVVVPDGKTFSDADIDDATAFQEKWFKHIIIRE
jgi:inorganic pyrophosphatase